MLEQILELMAVLNRRAKTLVNDAYDEAYQEQNTPAAPASLALSGAHYCCRLTKELLLPEHSSLK